MIVSICEKCSEGCSHCFINSLPRSPVMSEETLEATCAFLKRVVSNTLLISGGEFTEHPDFVRFTSRILEAKSNATGVSYLLSNGSWLFDDERRKGVEVLLKRPDVIGMQIRTHPKFYPNYKRTTDAARDFAAISDKISLHDDGINLIMLGRAKANHKDEGTKKYPLCSNLFLLARQTKPQTLGVLVTALEAYGKLCTPFVSSQGTIHAGETPYCQEIGRVTDSDAEILDKISRVVPKDACGLVKNFGPEHRKVIYGQV